jgi:hypothetical protein
MLARKLGWAINFHFFWHKGGLTTRSFTKGICNKFHTRLLSNGFLQNTFNLLRNIQTKLLGLLHASQTTRKFAKIRTTNIANIDFMLHTGKLINFSNFTTNLHIITCFQKRLSHLLTLLIQQSLLNSHPTTKQQIQLRQLRLFTITQRIYFIIRQNPP